MTYFNTFWLKSDSKYDLYCGLNEALHGNILNSTRTFLEYVVILEYKIWKIIISMKACAAEMFRGGRAGGQADTNNNYSFMTTDVVSQAVSNRSGLQINNIYINCSIWYKNCRILLCLSQFMDFGHSKEFSNKEEEIQISSCVFSNISSQQCRRLPNSCNSLGLS